MNTKKLLSVAIIALLPFGARAENISGAMYVAPIQEDINHPAPTTTANPMFGRIDIDTADQDHIASTAYVKGAYNSTIAAINRVRSLSQGRIYSNDAADYIDGETVGAPMLIEAIADRDLDTRSDQLVSGTAVIAGILSQHVEVWTTWEDDDETTDVALKTVVPED